MSHQDQVKQLLSLRRWALGDLRAVAGALVTLGGKRGLTALVAWCDGIVARCKAVVGDEGVEREVEEETAEVAGPARDVGMATTALRRAVEVLDAPGGEVQVQAHRLFGRLDALTEIVPGRTAGAIRLRAERAVELCAGEPKVVKDSSAVRAWLRRLGETLPVLEKALQDRTAPAPDTDRARDEVEHALRVAVAGAIWETRDDPTAALILLGRILETEESTRLANVARLRDALAETARTDALKAKSISTVT